MKICLKSKTRSGLWQRALHLLDHHRLKSERRRYSLLSEQNKLKVSIPLATYDRIDILIERTLPALLEQSYGNIEIIVVGDGTDPRLFKKLEQVRDLRLKTLLLPKRTRYPSDPLERWMVAGWRPRNIAAQMASGGWLLWMSDDDVINPAGIEALLRVAQANPEAEVISGGFCVKTEPPRSVLPSDNPLVEPSNFAGMPALLSKTYSRGLRWNGLSHLKDWNRPSDYDLIERYQRVGFVFRFTDEVVASVIPLDGTQLTGSKAFKKEYYG